MNHGANTRREFSLSRVCPQRCSSVQRESVQEYTFEVISDFVFNKKKWCGLHGCINIKRITCTHTHRTHSQPSFHAHTQSSHTSLHFLLASSGLGTPSTLCRPTPTSQGLTSPLNTADEAYWHVVEALHARLSWASHGQPASKKKTTYCDILWQAISWATASKSPSLGT